jgi:hypothetical protein
MREKGFKRTAIRRPRLARRLARIGPAAACPDPPATTLQPPGFITVRTGIGGGQRSAGYGLRAMGGCLARL